MAKKRTWNQEFRRSKNKRDTLDTFLARQIAQVVDGIEKHGINGKDLLLLLKAVNDECNSIAECFELEKGWKMKRNWFGGALLQTCLAGKDKVHANFAERLSILYFDMGWNLIESREPIARGVESIEVIYYTDCNQTTPIDVVVYPTHEFPIDSVWRSGSDQKWIVIGDEDKELVLRNIEVYGNRRVMRFSPKVVRAMKRVG